MTDSSGKIIFEPAITSDSGSFLSHSIVIKSLIKFDELQNEIKQMAQQGSANSVEFTTLVAASGSLTIAEVRELQRKLSLRSQVDRVVIIFSERLLPITQNALLKILEDGYSGTTLIIITLPTLQLLPTVESRVLVSRADAAINSTDLDAFTSLLVTERLEKWDTYTDTDVSKLAHTILSNQSIFAVDPSRLATFMDGYRSWQNGVLIQKYFFELMCLIVPITTDSKFKRDFDRTTD